MCYQHKKYNFCDTTNIMGKEEVVTAKHNLQKLRERKLSVITLSKKLTVEKKLKHQSPFQEFRITEGSTPSLRREIGKSPKIG